MSAKITGIPLPQSPFADYIEVNNTIKNLNRINIFVGSNNSGKSRFLRILFIDKDIEYQFAGIDLERYKEILKDLKQEVSDFNVMALNIDYANAKESVDLLAIPFGLNKDSKINQNIAEVLNKLKRLPTTGTYSAKPNYGINEIVTFYKSLSDRYEQKFNLSKSDWGLSFSKIYIPTLRGLRSVAYNSDKSKNAIDIYKERTEEDYFRGKISSNNEHSIFTGLNLYEETKKLLLGSRSERERVRSFEQFLSESFFENKQISLIPKYDDDVLHVLIDNVERRVTDLGDGIQSVIILTYPMFFRKGEKVKFYIEEPEQFLHPGYQRIYIETLLRPEFHTFQYFITSHSNHFLDQTLDTDNISVYNFSYIESKKSELFKIENVENNHLDTLALLGVRNSSVFLTNCTIWVEGITDRIYLRKYLDVYSKFIKQEKEYKEDLHYSFVEYGGGNITHWSFLEDDDPDHSNIDVERLCARLFLLTDSDNAGQNKDGEDSKKKIRQEQLSKRLGDNYYCLQKREFENLISPKILISTLAEIEDVEFVNLWKENETLQETSYSNEYLGKFIDANIKGISKSHSAQSGTIKNKVNFAKAVVKKIDDFSDLTNEAQEITKKLYDFIKAHNR